MTVTATLAELSNLNLDEVKEFRWSTFPKGAFAWLIVEAGLVTRGGEDNPAYIAKCKCTEVLDLIGSDKDPAELIGETHDEMVSFLQSDEDMEEFFGRVKAFCTDVGVENSGNLEAMSARLTGHTFKSRIKHRPDKNDKERIYADMVFGTK